MLFSRKPIATEEELALVGRNNNFDRTNKIENMKTWFVVSLWFAGILSIVCFTVFAFGLAGLASYYTLYYSEPQEILSLFKEYSSTAIAMIGAVLVKDAIKKRFDN